MILAEFGHFDLVASGVTKHLEQTHDDEKYQYFYIYSKEYTLFVLRAALYRAGRIDEAIARLEMSEKSYGKESPPSPELWIYLAMVHHKKGNADEARRWLEKARSTSRRSPRRSWRI